MTPRSHSTPALALMKAFCPGPAAQLRECRSVDWRSLTFEGERIEVEFELTDAPSRARAFELVGFAQEASAADIPLRGWMFADIAAEVRGDRLHVEGVAIRD
jgi:hypothetical protein